ncbi:MAG: UDP-N-acetylmuramoyl-L-alanyl-D-glutamate--2,6-diaminopimelate ligase [Gammaproteobacteria bacterium]|nr:UDP-N-acetylmuramoyl-L-alanyl-D-glutamate--2,6-diaminopimelate ligase [Gammaproteobacteria bacterium]
MSEWTKGNRSMAGHEQIPGKTPVNAIRLKALLMEIQAMDEDDDRWIVSLQTDSRDVTSGSLFIALAGRTVDGRDYIDEALENGAVAVLYESPGAPSGPARRAGVPMIAVEDLRNQLGRIASRFYRHPSREMTLAGITGTNGKTTTAFLLVQALELLGVRCAYSGTLGTGFLGQLQESDLTTVDSIRMHRRLAEFLDRGAQAVCMEISSHGLDQGRANGLDFDVAVFTNLTRDHLDYHRSMKRYGEAKRKLFEFESLDTAVINLDDEFGRELQRFCEQRKRGLQCLVFGMESGDLQPRNLQVDDQGIRFRLEYEGGDWEITSRLLGRINVPNLLCCIATLLGLKFPIRDIVPVIGQLGSPPGRMEAFRGDAGQPLVIVDYAHTQDALERALRSLKPLCRGKLVTVFGCGGDRDPGKRPRMGTIAETVADRVILTDDNPRTEPADQIVNQIKEGLSKPVTVIHDRKAAIAHAVKGLSSRDIVLVAGKGHESTQTTGVRARPLCDRSIVPELLGGAT